MGVNSLIFIWGSSKGFFSTVKQILRDKDDMTWKNIITGFVGFKVIKFPGYLQRTRVSFYRSCQGVGNLFYSFYIFPISNFSEHRWVTMEKDVCY